MRSGLAIKILGRERLVVVRLVSQSSTSSLPEPGYIDVVQQTLNVTPKCEGVGGRGKQSRDAGATVGAKVFLCYRPVRHRGDHSNDPLTLQSHDLYIDHTLRTHALDGCLLK